MEVVDTLVWMRLPGQCIRLLVFIQENRYRNLVVGKMAAEGTVLKVSHSLGLHITNKICV